MKNNLSVGAAINLRRERSERSDAILLSSDRPGWAWEFLRRNADYRAAAAGAQKAAVRTVGNITVLRAPDCAPEVGAFGICFR